MNERTNSVRFLSWLSLLTALLLSPAALPAPGEHSQNAPATPVAQTAAPAARAAGEPLFNLFVPTQRQDPHLGQDGKPDRHGPATLEFDGITLEQAKQVIRQLQRIPGLLPQFGPADRRPITEVIVSRNRPQNERQERLDAAKKWMNQVYAGKDPKFVSRAMASAGPQAIADAIDARITELQNENPNTPDAQADIQALRDANRQALADSQRWGLSRLLFNIKNWWKNWKWNPSVMSKADPTVGGWRKFYGLLAGGKALYDFAGRAEQASPGIWADVFSGNVASLATTRLTGAVTDGLFEYYLSRYEIAIGKNFMSGKNFDPARHPILSKLVPISKGALLNGVIRPTQAAVLLHLANHNVALLGPVQYAELIGAQLVGTKIYLKGLEGVELLRQKGVLTGPWAKFWLRFTGAFWPLSGLAFISPIPWMRALAPLTPLPIWGGQLGIYAAGKKMKPRNDRLILADPTVDRSLLDDMHALETTRKVDGTSEEKVAEAARELLQSPELQTAGPGIFSRTAGAIRNTCAMLLGRLRGPTPLAPKGTLRRAAR